jgi:FKBP-type peptidyl-prolyl cis-trans isomerase FkpA
VHVEVRCAQAAILYNERPCRLEEIQVKSVVVKFAVAATVFASAAIAATPALAGTIEKLPSGVVVEHLVDGTGPKPTASDVVKVNYRGTLTDGTEFDSSAKHGGAATFPLNRVIPCWTQGLQTIKVGGKAKLTCPAAMAYGDRGVGTIPPNSNLIFEVELVGIGQ